MIRYLFVLFVAASLSWIAVVRTDGFSPEIVKGPLIGKEKASPSLDLPKTFRYLGKGRQSYVFESPDGKTVLKFFNQKYLRMPWYSFLFREKESAKRSMRRKFYETSYEIAFREFGEEILYLHLGPSKGLPHVTLIDRASRQFNIDLNQFPFVLQNKGEPIGSALEKIYQKEGVEGLYRAVDQFLSLIAERIEKQVADADTDVVNNWGYVDGRLFHLDPGRLYYDERLTEPNRLKQEWHNGTRGLYKWLKTHYPEAALYQQKSLGEYLAQSTQNNFSAD